MAQEREKDFLISEKMKPFLNENGVLFYILYEDKLVVLQVLQL